MKLWHQKLIRHLPTSILAELDGKCRKHREENSLDIRFSSYHLLVMEELCGRGVELPYEWMCYNYLGARRGYAVPDDRKFRSIYLPARDKGREIFKDHDSGWMLECLDRLKYEELVGASVEELTLKAEAERTI